MQHAIALSSATGPDPVLVTAHLLVPMLASGDPIQRETLRDLMSQVTRQSDADGCWTMRDAYDALELAQVLFVTGPDWSVDDTDPMATLAYLERLVSSLPTQSYRAEEQVALQAFSTPLPLAWLAGRAARLSSGEAVLEPSAGTGLLAAAAKRAGCRLILNEIDASRRRCLAEAYPDARLSDYDAELIDDLLDPAIRPDVVLMNPPFARSRRRGDDRYAAARHLSAALVRLRPGGRLVAIMPESFSKHGSGRALRAKVEAQATLRLDALLSSGAFAKHGTGVSVRLVVYDKHLGGGSAARLQTSSLATLLDHVEAVERRPCPSLQPATAKPKLFPMFGSECCASTSFPSCPADLKSWRLRRAALVRCPGRAGTSCRPGGHLPSVPAQPRCNCRRGFASHAYSLNRSLWARSLPRARATRRS
jgi:predicted RNA methylase